MLRVFQAGGSATPKVVGCADRRPYVQNPVLLPLYKKHIKLRKVKRQVQIDNNGFNSSHQVAADVAVRKIREFIMKKRYEKTIIKKEDLD